MGVRLAKRGSRQQDHEVIRADKAVVSNASVWDTQRLLPPGAAPASWRQQAMTTPQTGSFVHLHLGAATSSSLPVGFATGDHLLGRSCFGGQVKAGCVLLNNA